MDAVEEILAAHGYDDPLDLPYNDPVKVEIGDAMMPLTIEKVRDDSISVAHHYTKMGDLMYDPEIVYKVSGDRWTPVRYTQHPYIHQYDPDGLDLDGFEEKWNRNIREQGYVEAAHEEGGR